MAGDGREQHELAAIPPPCSLGVVGFTAPARRYLIRMVGSAEVEEKGLATSRSR